MPSDYPPTAVPFENFALPDLHDPIVQGPGFGGLEGAADVYMNLAETLDKASGDLRAVMTASLGVHEGEAADAGRQHIGKVAAAGDVGAAQARLATLAMQEQATYYARAALDMKAAAEAAGSAGEEKARVQAVDAARLYETNSNHNLSTVFQAFEPPRIPAPDVSIAAAPHDPGWARSSGGGAAAAGVPTTPAATGLPNGTTGPGTLPTPAAVPSMAGDPAPGANAAAVPGPGTGGNAPTTVPPVGGSPPTTTPSTTTPPGATPGTTRPGPVTTSPSTVQPNPESLDRSRTPSLPGVADDPGGVGRTNPKPVPAGTGTPWTPGQPWSSRNNADLPLVPGAPGTGAGTGSRGGGSSLGADPRPGTEPRPGAGRPSGLPASEPILNGTGASRAATAGQHGMPFMPMGGAGMGRQGGTHERPPWLLDADPDETWMSNLPEHGPGVLEPLED
ncbi:hypothetical protein [Pseudonocardia sp. GCM10023141]|uniref:hypothetical protein n=1 Tax=Pseudonocardia sp. GCM10023141 TaxID=3252653 RepID=UPI00360D1724